MHRTHLTCLLAAVLCFSCFPSVFGQPASIFDEIYRGPDHVPHLTLRYSWDSLEHRSQQQTPGTVRFRNRDGESEVWPVRLEKRGAFRQVKCDYPPLKLDFGKGRLRERGLSTHDDIKLVRFCIPGEEGKDYLLREFLTYQLLQVLTDHALRVQLVQISYQDLGGPGKDDQLAILIEDIDQLAERLQLKQAPKDRMGFGRDVLDLPSALRTALFEYMIGNADWSLFLGKNVKMLEDTSRGLFHCIPYDFDFSGLVNASAYAKPMNGQKIQTDRMYRGPAVSRQEMTPIVEEFLAKQDELNQRVRECALLSEASRQEILAYLDEFFAEVNTRAFYKMVERAEPIENKF